MSLKLTQYLYNLEEVKLKYYISLFLKKDLNECYFWIYEIYYSGFKNKTIDIILELYYEYYAILNQNAERKIKELIENEEEDMELIPAKLTKFLFNLQFNYDIFSIIQLIKNMINERNENKLFNILIKLIDKSRVTSYIKPFDIKYHQLFTSIYKKKYFDICISLSLFIYDVINIKNKEELYNNFNELYNNLIKFKKNVLKIDLIYYFSELNSNCNLDIGIKYNHLDFNLDNKDTDEYTDEERKIKMYIYKNIILVFDIYYSLLNSSYNKNTLKKINDEDFHLNSKELKYIFSLNNENLIFSKINPGSILKNKRLFFIHQNNYYIMGAFNLLRFNNIFKDQEEYINETLLNWDYYSYNTPIWRERFDKLNGIIDIERKKIIFKDDDDDIKYESFYDKYGYELDEQPSIIYDLYYIDKCNYNVWFEFLSECILDERNKFNKNNKVNINYGIIENSINNTDIGINYINEYYKYMNDNINNIEISNSIELNTTNNNIELLKNKSKTDKKNDKIINFDNIDNTDNIFNIINSIIFYEFKLFPS